MDRSDIFNLDNLESVVRNKFGTNKEVKLKDLTNNYSAIPNDYERIELKLESEEVFSELRDKIQPICTEFEKEGYGANLFTAVYEAVLNAYQHGNKKDTSKKITLAYKHSLEHLDLMVEDEGGVVDSNFVPFVLRHREGVYKEKFLNFYEFSGKEKPDKNQGTGTSFMHQYVDSVNYLISEKGGLIVHMVRNKPAPEKKKKKKKSHKRKRRNRKN